MLAACWFTSSVRQIITSTLCCRSSRHRKDHQHPVFGPRSAGSLHERRCAGAQRFKRQVRLLSEVTGKLISGPWLKIMVLYFYLFNLPYTLFKVQDSVNVDTVNPAPTILNYCCLYIHGWVSHCRLLCLQRNRCGEEQDQDVCSTESHTAQRTTQDHHPGRSRQVRRQVVHHLGSELYSRLCH